MGGEDGNMPNGVCQLCENKCEVCHLLTKKWSGKAGKDWNSCAEWERDLSGNIVQTDGFFVLTVLCETSPQVLQLLLKLDQSLAVRLGPTWEILKQTCLRQPRDPFRRQTMALVPWGKHPPLSKVICCLWRVVVG